MLVRELYRCLLENSGIKLGMYEPDCHPDAESERVFTEGREKIKGTEAQNVWMRYALSSPISIDKAGSGVSTAIIPSAITARLTALTYSIDFIA